MKKNTDLVNKILLYSPILLGIVIMLPRLLSPNFGFFDDASAISRAQEILAGHWNPFIEASGGRFRPLYWFYYAFMYRIFGIHPLGFFIGNLLLFLFLIYCIIQISLTLGVDRKVAWLVGLVFALAGPVLESIYTLCKLELLQGVLILVLLACCEFYVRMKTWYWKMAVFILMVFIAFLVCDTKETGILLVPSALISLVIYWLWGKFGHQQDKSALIKRIILWWASLIGVIAYLVVASIYMKGFVIGRGSGNFNFSPGWLYSQFRLLVDWMIRDYLYLLPLGLSALVALYKKSNRNYLPVLLECVWWIFIWAAIYIPYLYLPEYYLLPVALIFAILFGLMLSLTLSLLIGNHTEQIIAFVSLSMTALLIAMTIPNQITNARLQIALDRANADMLFYVTNNAPQGNTILINIQEENEYVVEFTLWVNTISNRPDLHVDYVHGDNPIAAETTSQEIWIVSPYMENQFYPSVRLGVYEHTSKAWNQSMEIYLNGKGERVEDIRESFQLFNFDPMRFFCPLTVSLRYCQVPNAPLDNRTFTYGWTIDRIP